MSAIEKGEKRQLHVEDPSWSPTHSLGSIRFSTSQEACLEVFNLSLRKILQLIFSLSLTFSHSFVGFFLFTLSLLALQPRNYFTRCYFLFSLHVLSLFFFFVSLALFIFYSHSTAMKLQFLLHLTIQLFFLLLFFSTEHSMLFKFNWEMFTYDLHSYDLRLQISIS